MDTNVAGNLKDGDQCLVTGGTHKGKTGTVRDINTSKTGHRRLLSNNRTQ
ncbi:KOW motif-containing protein [Pedobacter caeni]|uniref:KOW motif-containing protein n=1 Tax=Pedobacter caeni TaxID=288992 RepID=A0A1M4VX97_9SPHI|nr:KOW motif-containing protein [Pedobacter caeni]SHE73596.1 KOW motif-containing protein [Pedobacter caeni]